MRSEDPPVGFQWHYKMQSFRHLLSKRKPTYDAPRKVKSQNTRALESKCVADRARPLWHRTRIVFLRGSLTVLAVKRREGTGLLTVVWPDS